MRRIVVIVALAAGALIGQTRLTLEDAEQIALKGNPQIGVATFNALVAEQATREVRSNYFPNIVGSLTGVGGNDATRIGAGSLTAGSIYNRIGTGVSASQLLWDFGRTGSLVEASRLRELSLGQNTQFTRALVRLQVDRAYFAALRGQSVLRVAEQTVAARQLVVDQVTALAESNLKSTLDVSFARVNLSEVKLLLAQAQNDVQAAFADLASAMGLREADPQWMLVDTAMGSGPEPDPAALLVAALKNRPDVASARLDVESAKRLIAAERALSMPTVSAVAAGGALPVHSDLMTGTYSGAALNVNVPVFNGHAFSARRGQAEYRASAVEQNLRDLQNRVARDVKVAWLGTATAWQRVGLTAEFLDQAALALELAQARYDLGLSSIVELSQAQLSKTNAEIQQASARYDFQLQSAVLKFQTGALVP